MNKKNFVHFNCFFVKLERFLLYLWSLTTHLLFPKKFLNLNIFSNEGMCCSLKHGIFKNGDIGIFLLNDLNFKNFGTGVITKLNLISDMLSLSLAKEFDGSTSIYFILTKNLNIINFHFNIGIEDRDFFTT